MTTLGDNYLLKLIIFRTFIFLRILLYNRILLHHFPGFILLEKKLQVETCQVRKVIQLHETMIVRWGVMLVGPTGGGKTVVLHVSNVTSCTFFVFTKRNCKWWIISTMVQVLGGAYARLHELEVPGPTNQPVHMFTMNPKSLTIGELYGEVNLQTLEWHDGILPLCLRTAVQVKLSHTQNACPNPKSLFIYDSRGCTPFCLHSWFEKCWANICRSGGER